MSALLLYTLIRGLGWGHGHILTYVPSTPNAHEFGVTCYGGGGEGKRGKGEEMGGGGDGRGKELTRERKWVREKNRKEKESGGEQKREKT